MIIVKRRIATIAICMVAIGMTASGMKLGAEITGDSSSLELTLSVEDGTFALYEPVVVTYTITNPTDTLIEAMVFLDLFDRSIDISIAHNGQPGQLFTSDVNICTTHTEPNRFPAHESKSRSIGLFYNHTTRGLAFPAPGTYKIEGRLHSVEVRPIVIQVVEPGGRDREAIGFLGSEADLVRLQRYGVAQYCKDPASRAACVQRLLTFLDRYATSAYAPAVAFHLAMAKAAGSNPQGIARDLPKSEDLLDMFFKSWAANPFAPDVIELLAGELARSGQAGDAKRWVDRFRENYPNRKDQLEGLESQLSKAGVE